MMNANVSRPAWAPKPPRALWGAGAGVVILIPLLVILPLWFWTFCRIEVDSGEIAVLIRKTGDDLPSGQILATTPGQKGIQPNVLTEGRYFRNPYTWAWEIHPIIDIPAGRLGVQRRLYGNDLPPGKIIAEDENGKGIVKDILRPGKHRLNPYAYAVNTFDAVNIQPGCVGVVTALTGGDVLTANLSPDQRNTYLVPEGLKGVRASVLAAGTYYLNPYMFNVVEVNLQSQRFEMSGEDAIGFLTSDGFSINAEGTLEYAIEANKAALLTQQVGDRDDILRKLILPRARGFSRIEGSKNPAKNFITGDTRQKFQDNLETHLRTLCEPWGVNIRSVLIRNITPPEDIASIIREREVAVQDARKYEQQIEQAKSKAELTRQEMLATQNTAKVQADTARIRAVIKAQQDQAVQLTQAQRELEVAQLERDAAEAQAQAVLTQADAEKEVLRLQNEAQAQVLSARVKAFGGGAQAARQAFYEKMGPRIQSVISGDGPENLGALFKYYLPTVSGGGAHKKEVTP